MSGINLGLSVTPFVFFCKKFIMYFVLLVSLVFISDGSTISLYHLFVYIRESPIWKVGVGVVVGVCVEPIQKKIGGVFRGQYNICEIAYLIASSSKYGVKPIGLPVLG